MIAIGFVMAGCGADGRADAPATAAEQVSAAEALCPILWTWVTDVGDVFNVAAADVADLESPADRRGRWFASFEEIRTLNAGLLESVAPLADDPVLAPLVDQVVRDVPLSLDELDDIEALFAEFPEVDEQRHQERTMQVVVRIEKVIELPKPELAAIDPDGSLREAFGSVDSCRHSVRDVTG